MLASNRITVALLCLTLWPLANANADDWGQWMGPNRDGVYRETGIINAIPESGLKVKWRMPIKSGYAGPAVADGKVFVFDYEATEGKVVNDYGSRAQLAGSERLVAFDEATGKQLWTHEYDCPYNISYPSGPRCTPTVDGDRVYILGSEGDLRCVQTEDGSLVWKKNLKNDFGAEVPMWGFASHPLIDGDLLYTMVGGKGQGIVAFDKLTGDVKWKSLDCAAGYCPPIIIEKGGARQLIAFNPTSVASLNPADGKQYWSVPIESLYEMSIVRPMLDGDFMYVCGKGNQSVMLKLDSTKPAATEVWRGRPRKSIYGANATPMFVDGMLYGADQDMGCLIAADGKDGTRLWQTFDATNPAEDRKLAHGTAFVTRMGDTNRYLIMSEVGDLLISELTREKYTPHGRFHVLEPTGTTFGRSFVWSHPAYANKTAYIRNDEEIVAVDLSK
ncbi:PQQ-binding-like beta-propeller repeat protein [Mariniblastus fucicola]|uniref:Outer membrane biogenesis protein BamB n=1 Tax=Mariniblastus fucicola TaxID=980251 RepID=A0A5B9PI48_9BACT|nr:PQQ-binding-like beta-propeller repeat protein [Mariniblastus fucicola]QEG24970.1 outer membrane biogenesis protein BamB [Mariniblastus fucicola]